MKLITCEILKCTKSKEENVQCNWDDSDYLEHSFGEVSCCTF